jgi:hypothetical protein
MTQFATWPNGTSSGTYTPSGLHTGLRTTAITVTDSPQKIPATPLPNRNSISIRVIGSNTVYFGDSSVTTSNGYPKFINEELSMDVTDSNAVAIWAVCSTGQTCQIRIIEIA